MTRGVLAMIAAALSSYNYISELENVTQFNQRKTESGSDVSSVCIVRLSGQRDGTVGSGQKVQVPAVPQILLQGYISSLR